MAGLPQEPVKAVVTRSQAVESVVNAAVRQCLLEFRHAGVRGLGAKEKRKGVGSL